MKKTEEKLKFFITKKGKEELLKMSNAMLAMEKELLKDVNTEDLITLNKLLDKLNTDK